MVEQDGHDQGDPQGQRARAGRSSTSRELDHASARRARAALDRLRPRYAKNRRFYVYLHRPRRRHQVAQLQAGAEQPGAASSPGSLRKVIAIPHRELPEPQRRAGLVRARRQPLARDRRRRLRLRPERERPEPRLAARQAAADQPRKATAATRSRRTTRSSAGTGATRSTRYGLRNPFRFSFDAEDEDDRDRRRRPGRLGGDRLPRRLEGASGANFGWDALRGQRRRSSAPAELPGLDDDTPAPPDDRAADPRSTSDDPERYTGCAVIGGPVVRDQRLRVAVRPATSTPTPATAESRASSRHAAAAPDDAASGPRRRRRRPIVEGRKRPHLRHRR